MTEIDSNTLHDCKEGREDSWRKLFSCSYPLAKWVVVHTLYGVDDYTVNSLAQETMVALVENISRIADEQHLRRFVKRVTRNKCIDYIRRHREQFGDVPETMPDVVEPSVDDTTIDALHQAVANLGEPCHTIVRSRFLDGLSYKELAVKVNVEVGQVGVRISRCLASLRKALEQMDISREDLR